MNSTEFSGFGIAAVGAIQLVYAIGAGKVLLRWPQKSIKREDNPELYAIVIRVSLAGVVGGLIIAVIGAVYIAF